MKTVTQRQPKPLADRLRAWRLSHRWTQDMAAEFLDVNRRTYENWELGSAAPRGIGLKALEARIKGNVSP